MTSGSGHGNRDSKQSRNRANRVEWRIEDFNKRQAGQSSLFHEMRSFKQFETGSRFEETIRSQIKAWKRF